jgi:glycerophosphoryl diester phosphodiesterase
MTRSRAAQALERRVPGKPLRLAHRGDWRRAPENTVAAMLAALNVPACDGLEFDVRRAVDGTPILLHDTTLSRVQWRHERADELSVIELRASGIPTLEETLQAVGPEPFLDVELKDDPGPLVVDVLEAARGPALDKTVVSSFNVVTLGKIRRARPTWSCWLNARQVLPTTVAQAVELGCRGVAVEQHAIDERIAGSIRNAGLEMAGWGVRDEATFERLAALGLIAVVVEEAALDG